MTLPIIPRFSDVPGLSDYLKDLSRAIEIGQRPQIGSQPYNGNLQALSGLVGAADKLPYFTGLEAMALTGLTAAGRAIIDDVDAAAQLTTLGVSAFIKTLLDDADATAALATLGVSSGLWTPIVTNVSNVVASTAHVGMYIRIGSIVHCAVMIEIDPNLFAPTATSFRLSIPIASNFTAVDQASGGLMSRVNGSGHVTSVIATDDVLILYNASNAANLAHDIVFSYQVLP